MNEIKKSVSYCLTSQKYIYRIFQGKIAIEVNGVNTIRLLIVCNTCFLDDRDVPQAEYNHMYNAGLAQRDRFLSNLRRPHAKNLEVRYNLHPNNPLLGSYGRK